MRRFLPCLAALALLLTQSSTFAAAVEKLQSVIVTVTLNGESKGEYYVYLAADGEYLVKESDLLAMGVTTLPKTEPTAIDGENFVRVKTLPDAEVTFNEARLELNIVLSPKLLSRHEIDLAAPLHASVLRPRDTSAFFNYRFDQVRGTGISSTLSFAGEFGVRWRDFLFSTNRAASRSDAERSNVRLLTSLTHDNRATLNRFVAGDFVATSGELGSGFTMGGLSYSKTYAIAPEMIKQPTGSFAGLARLPAQAEIYLDGNRIRTERLTPGEFQLKNFNYYGGAHDVEVVVKDALGREERVRYPFYFSDQLLRQGLQEFSYSIGRVRNNFGIESNSYGAGALLGFHRYGLKDWLTLGGHGEAAGGRFNLGPDAIVRLGTAGVLSASVSRSRERGAGGGWASGLAYTYERGSFAGRVLARNFGKDYARIQDSFSSVRVLGERAAGLTYGTVFGNFGLDYLSLKRAQRTERRVTTLSYSRSFFLRWSLFATLSQVKDEAKGAEFFVGLNWNPGEDLNATYLHQKRLDTGTEDVLQFGKTPPVGEGYGYRIELDRLSSNDGEHRVLAPFFQYNHPYGILAAELRSEQRPLGGRSDTHLLSASGALGWVDGVAGFMRPVTDSFALVRVADLDGVRIYHNNQVAGRTNAKGHLFVPTLASYAENNVSISDKDIPIEYTLNEVNKYVAPPLRSGSAVTFAAKRIQAIVAKLKLKTPSGNTAAEFYEVQLQAGAETITVPTAKGGEFYIENIQPGEYKLTARHLGTSCAAKLNVPASKEAITELGDVVCVPLN